MADWPDTVELAKVLNVDDAQSWDTTLDRVLASAIAIVKSVRGSWDEDVDEPTDNLAQAALRAAELLSERPSMTGTAFAAARSTVLGDPTFNALMIGQRRKFGVA